jgi:hypothetical protein
MIEYNFYSIKQQKVQMPIFRTFGLDRLLLISSDMENNLAMFLYLTSEISERNSVWIVIALVSGIVCKNKLTRPAEILWLIDFIQSICQ